MLKKQVLVAMLVLGTVGTVAAQSEDWKPTPNATCTLTPREFSTWFVSGSASKGGVVRFANSVGFPTQNTVCDFYKWSHRMFLWTTSLLDGDVLLDSPVFYDVNFDNNGNAIFIPNDPNARGNSFALRGAKPQSIQPGGQAGGGDTLLSLNGSLVYFGVHVNDVYAWFNTAVTNNVLPASTPFPTTQAELNKIVTYAAANKAKLGDANALTMELKTAWVDAKSVSQPADYVSIQAAVPNYVGKVGDKVWTISKTQPTVIKTLVLVGIHVVGPVQGHPEMVWATFEHRSNAPDNTFYVTDKSGQTKQVPYNSSGAWSFMTNDGQQAGALAPQMKVDGATGNITATTGNTIRPNNVYRVMPWGNAPTVNSANNNSQLISLNGDIRSMLTKLRDVRSNYFQVGAVWTQNGSIPNSGTDTAKQIGSKLLANSTMETYHQSDKMGCFGCHFVSPATPPAPTTGTSHLFSPTNNPLVPPPSK